MLVTPSRRRARRSRTERHRGPPRASRQRNNDNASGRSVINCVDAPLEQPARVGLVIDRPDLHAEAGACAPSTKRGETTRVRPAHSGT